MRNDKLLIDVLSRATEVKSRNDFVALIKDSVTRVLPHEIMICGMGIVHPDGSVIQKFLNLGYPLGYYNAIKNSDGKVDTPLMKIWRQTHVPVLYQAGRDEEKYSAEWVALINKFDLRNIIGHGALDLNGPFSSYFIFSRLPGEVGEYEVEVLNLITPHLHNALTRISSELALSPDQPDFVFALSERQKEILGWINVGKSNWEIAQIVDTTQANVKYHVEQIYQKLGVSTRVQAVAYAKDLGILPSFRGSDQVKGSAA
jgi:transcriptional regulator EpsA